MSQAAPSQSYEVHLTDDIATELGVDSPVETDRIDYYDSGIWVADAAGRVFYPYRHVLAIREVTAAGAAESAAGTGVQSGSTPEEPEP